MDKYYFERDVLSDGRSQQWYERLDAGALSPRTVENQFLKAQIKKYCEQRMYINEIFESFVI